LNFSSSKIHPIDLAVCSSAVRMHVMHVLGLIAERFPAEMAGRDSMLLDVYLSSLQQEVARLLTRSRSDGHQARQEVGHVCDCRVSCPTITHRSALKGLTSFLVHFTQSFDEGGLSHRALTPGVGANAKARQIYKFMLMSIQPASELKRYEVCCITLLTPGATRWSAIACATCW
jgi:hypothetical protein